MAIRPTAKSISQQTIAGATLKDEDMKGLGFTRFSRSHFKDDADRYVNLEEGVWLRTSTRLTYKGRDADGAQYGTIPVLEIDPNQDHKILWPNGMPAGMVMKPKGAK
jgi:hypothetical protein